jgi:thiol:disulfide interchange protein DsbD
MKAAGYVLMRADWTRRDEEITRALAALGRKGVPVYAVYRPDREPELLPELLTRDVLFAALKP